MSTDERKIRCPYCDTHFQPDALPLVDAERAVTVVCPQCHKPIALYSNHARALKHQDRTVKAISMELLEYPDDAIYLEFVETQFSYKQELPVPLGTSVMGRYNANSSAELQLLTTDPSLGRNHIQLRLSNSGVLTVADNQSLTGTYVNGELLNSKEQRRLLNGDVLTLGATTAIVHTPDEGDDYLY